MDKASDVDRTFTTKNVGGSFLYGLQLADIVFRCIAPHWTGVGNDRMHYRLLGAIVI